MNKNDNMKNISVKYCTLIETQKDEFSRVSNKLLAINYICGSKPRDKKDYYFIDANLELFEKFFLLLDYRLELNPADKVVYIENSQGYNPLSLKKIESVILLLLRKMYFVKMQEISQTELITITFGELHAEIEATGLFNNRISKTELMEACRILTKYNICEKIGDHSEDDSRLIIYPTINYALPVSKLEELQTKINSYKRGEDDEEIS